MGSSTSKAAKKASQLSATNTARKYPTRSPPPTSNRATVQPQMRTGTPNLGPTVQPPSQVADSMDQATNLSALDPNQDKNPGLQSRLQSLGPVQPNPAFSNSSTFNTRAPLENPANPSSKRPSPQSSPDASLSSTFVPSASNPLQSIFPTQTQPLNGGKPAGGRVNPAVSLLTARYRLAAEAEAEFARLGKGVAEGRRFLDVVTLRQILVLRDEKGVEAAEIERRLGLKRGLVAQLGRKGVVGVGGGE